MNEVNKMSTWFECKVKYDKMMENGIPNLIWSMLFLLPKPKLAL